MDLVDTFDRPLVSSDASKLPELRLPWWQLMLNRKRRKSVATLFEHVIGYCIMVETFYSLGNKEGRDIVSESIASLDSATEDNILKL